MLNLRDLYSQITAPNKNQENHKLFLLPLIPGILWVLFSFLSIFTLNFTLITSPFVILSLLARFLFPLYVIFFIRKFYILRDFKSINYNHTLNFIGYSISLTYVSYMLPGVVLDFYQKGSTSLFFTIMVFLSALSPLALYLILKNPKVKVASTYFTVKEVNREKKVKKDKSLKRANQKLLRAERNIFQNIWFEVLDPLMWAILWVLLINNTLFQLYQIPSSSMVPEFLEQDRVVASKIFSGPGIPLTKYQFPEIIKPKAGDIVTFNNPKVDDPNSDLHYKSVFTRIFQPFVYMLTFSKLDIDTDEEGNPKARQLVKRVIAAPGEKICMVNDKVYKKTKNTDWTLMSQISGEQEWGKANLFELDNKNSGNQYMNPKLRSELDTAAKLVDSYSQTDLENKLEEQKKQFLLNLSIIDKIQFLNNLISYNRNNDNRASDIREEIERFYFYMMQVNRADIPKTNKNSIENSFNTILEHYDIPVIFEEINNLKSLVEMDIESIDANIEVALKVKNDPSPYDIFATKLEGLYSLKLLEMYNQLLSGDTFIVDNTLAQQIKILSVYIHGLKFNNFTHSFYASGNLPEFPIGKDSYIPENEYFLLGDNRYNSLDSRMGDFTIDQPLTENSGLLSQSVSVNWEPHTINSKYIHGEVKVIIFPFDHFKLFTK